MKKYILACIAAVAITMVSSAATYDGSSMELSQPDGSKVEVRLFGTEYFMRAESPDGYTLILDPETKWICYAVTDENGDLVSSGIRYSNENLQRTTESQTGEPDQETGLAEILQQNGIEKGLRYPALQRQEIIEKTTRQLKQIEDEASMDAMTAPAPGVSGTINQLAILIDFPDRMANVSKAEIESAFNSDNYNDKRGSIKKWVQRISNNIVTVNTHVIGYYRTKNNTSHYLRGGTWDYSAAIELRNEALPWADANFNFASLTTENGRVKSIQFLYTGDVIANGWANSLWPHAGWHDYQTQDGVKTGTDFICNIGNSVPINDRLWVFRHELGHSLFSWPDCYDYDGDSHSGGGFQMETDLPCAPFRAIHGWINVVNINNNNMDYNLPADANTVLKYSNPSNSREYFMVEYLRKTDWRDSAPDEGLLIWHVDEDGNNSWQDMTASRHYRHSVEQADGLFELEYNIRSGSDGDLFHGGYKTTFDDGTTPNAKWWSGANSGLRVGNIGNKGGDTMYVRIGNGGQACEAPNASVSGTTSSSISLSWNNANASYYYIWIRPNGGNWFLAAESLTTTSYTLAGLAEGTSYEIDVYSACPEGTYPVTRVTATTQGTTDSQAPTTPGAPAFSSISKSSVVVSWTASSDNVGVTAYDLYMNNSLQKTVTGTSTTISGLTCDTTYAFKVQAKDAAGNLSAFSTESSVTTDACDSTSTAILNKDEQLARWSWWDNKDWDWYKDNIPFFESPENQLDKIYYYRWELTTKHLVYGSPNDGYSYTEFLDRPFWSGAYGAIACPAGHQIYETRWLRNRRYVQDFCEYWYHVSGAQPRNYTTWLADSVWATYLVHKDRSFATDLLSPIKTNYQGWENEYFVPSVGLFARNGHDDGMELSITSRQTSDTVRGGSGYRATLNSYMYADAKAIRNIALLIGDETTANTYESKATNLKANMQSKLWHSGKNFFLHRWKNDEINGIQANTLNYETGPYAGNPHGRELYGYVPWMFNIPDDSYSSAWQYLMNSDYFYAPYGPTTTEQGDPQFLVTNHCCWWSGQSWPFATTQTLKGMANLLQNYSQGYVSKADYVALLKVYANTHTKNGLPYLAEGTNPFNNSWEGYDGPGHSEHYFHSGYVDLIISGLMGLVPRSDDVVEINPLFPDSWDYAIIDDVPYHGHLLTILWDRTGNRYQRGAGLKILIDGQEIASSATVGPLTGTMPKAKVPARDASKNWAVNNTDATYPQASASYTSSYDKLDGPTDGQYWYINAANLTRWTCYGSPNSSDWWAVDFGQERLIDTVKLYFFDDGGGVQTPASYDLQYWNGSAWVSVPGQTRSPTNPTGSRANTITFSSMATSKMRVVMTHQGSAKSGLAEFEAWESIYISTDASNLAPSATVTASYTSSHDSTEEANDEIIQFAAEPRNRWTCWGSGNSEDWLQLTWSTPQHLSALDLYIYDDGGGVKPPESYTVQYWTGSAWEQVSNQTQSPLSPSSGVNNVTFSSVNTLQLRVVFTHQSGAYSGLTEIKAYGTEEPTAPGTPTFSLVAKESAIASWTPSTDNIGVTAYEVHLNGSLLQTVSETSAIISGLECASSYQIKVRAKDADGNTSAFSPESELVTTECAGGANQWDGYLVNDGVHATQDGVLTPPPSIATTGTRVYTSSSTNWENDQDDGVLFYKNTTGDFSAFVQITDGTFPSMQGISDWLSAGLMARNPNASSIDWVALFAFDHPEWNSTYMLRSTDGGVSSATSTTGLASTLNQMQWQRLDRIDDTFTAYYSADGNSWTAFGSVSRPDMPDTVQLGLGLAQFGTNNGWVQFENLFIGDQYPEDPYTLWAASHNLQGGLLDDDDNDGICNLLEYALDGHPGNGIADIQTPALLKDGETLVFVHMRRTDDDALIYQIETSTNLVSGVWTNAGFTAIGTNATGGIRNDVTNAVPILNDEAFIRLKVEKH